VAAGWTSMLLLAAVWVGASRYRRGLATVHVGFNGPYAVGRLAGHAESVVGDMG